MDKKIILVILIVALIGIVAATYNINTDTIANQLASVGIEDSADSDTDSATDLLAVSGDSVNTPTSSDSSSSTTGSSNNNNANSGTSNSNSGTSNSNSGTSSSNSNAQTTTSQTNNITSQNKTTKYTISQATVIANNWMASQSEHTTAKASYHSTFTSDNGDVYYVFIFRENGKVVGEIEMNAQTGSVTGGAFEGEVNPPSNNTTN
ncbi:hypothetical protein [Methanosphaera sp.]